MLKKIYNLMARPDILLGVVWIKSVWNSDINPEIFQVKISWKVGDYECYEVNPNPAYTFVFCLSPPGNHQVSISFQWNI